MNRRCVTRLALLFAGFVWAAGTAPAPQTADEGNPVAGTRAGQVAADAPAEERAQEAAATAFLKRFRPDVAARLETLRRDQPERHRGVIHDAEREAKELETIKAIAPQEYAERVRELDYRARPYHLAAQYLSAPEDRKESIRKELVDLLGRTFERRQFEMKTHLLELEERIAELREKVQSLQADKAGMVDEYVRDLIRDGGGERLLW